MTEADQVSRDPGTGVREERRNVDLGIPEVVSLVRLSGQALRRDAVRFCPCRCLSELEDVPSDCLLDARLGGTIASDTAAVDFKKLRRSNVLMAYLLWPSSIKGTAFRGNRKG